MSKEPSVFDKKGKIDPAVDPVAHDAGGHTVSQKVLVRNEDDKPAVAHDYHADERSPPRAASPRAPPRHTKRPGGLERWRSAAFRSPRPTGTRCRRSPRTPHRP